MAFIGILGIIAIIVVAVIVVFVISMVVVYNGLVRLRNMAQEAFATMDVYLKKRFDIVPNLVETVKGYAAHESSTLEKVARARDMVRGAAGDAQRMQGEAELTSTLRGLFAVAESYPDLKANAGFVDLQRELMQIEGEIAQSRKYHNAVVRDYNTKTETFPSVLVANMFRFQRMAGFEVRDAAERENVKVGF